MNIVQAETKTDVTISQVSVTVINLRANLTMCQMLFG